MLELFPTNINNMRSLNKVLTLGFAILIYLSLVCTAVGQDFFENYFPSNIRLGLSAETVQQSRPGLLKINALNNTTDFSFMEIARNESKGTAFLYYFKDAQLRAIGRTSPRRSAQS